MRVRQELGYSYNRGVGRRPELCAAGPTELSGEAVGQGRWEGLGQKKKKKERERESESWASCETKESDREAGAECWRGEQDQITEGLLGYAQPSAPSSRGMVLHGRLFVRGMTGKDVWFRYTTWVGMQSTGWGGCKMQTGDHLRKIQQVESMRGVKRGTLISG